MCLIGMRVRPSSTVSCTGMSRIMLMSFTAPGTPAALKSVNATGLELVAAMPSRAVFGSAAGVDSASAAAHSAAIASSSDGAAAASLPSSADIAFSQPAHGGAGQQLIDLQRIPTVG